MSTEQSNVGQSEQAGIEDGLIANAQGAVGVVHATSESVDERLDLIREAASAQVEDMESVAEDVTDLSATIEEVAASADEVSETTERAATAASDGREATGEATEAMEAASTATQQVAARVETLEAEIDRINEVVDVIDDIAQQTNLLALNASIEAARAGEEGDGFAVVAEEVKSLAEESQSRTEEIETAVDEIQSVTDELTGALDEAVDAVEAGADEVDTAESQLDIVDDEMASAAAGVEEVSEAVSEGAEASTRVANVTRNTADAAREIESSVSEIHDERAQTTALLGEIDDALSTARQHRDRRLRAADRVPTGLDDFDRDGGLPAGSRDVILADTDGSTTDRAVDEAVAGFAAAAVDAGWAVSLSPTASMDRSTLASVLKREAGVTLDDALASNRLFVLDLFGSWRPEENVIDVTEHGLSRANSQVDAKRDRPCVVIGNIAGELDLMGEAAVRENTYDNDGETLSDDDLVVNVVDESAVPNQLQSFYVGAADTICHL
ncbi:methyl-accepting chemotaxis protein [Halohasta salina]|uniref:methyl-accepting chemotaxis protein n=1 Tax=Halohasta salina TaxID=2961621 RepID=UPI0020A27EB9|nr:methyl-accepting chemotaxis protein [Halohasta salina]